MWSTEVEISVMKLQAQELLEPPEAGRGNKEFPGAFRRSDALPTLGFQTYGLQNYERIICSCFKLSS